MSVLERPNYTQSNAFQDSQTLTNLSSSYAPRRTPPQQQMQMSQTADMMPTYTGRRTPYQNQREVTPKIGSIYQTQDFPQRTMQNPQMDYMNRREITPKITQPIHRDEITPKITQTVQPQVQQNIYNPPNCTWSSRNPLISYPYDQRYSNLNVVKDKANLNYYAPYPTNTFKVNPLEMTSLKVMDVDDVQEIFGKSIAARRDKETARKNVINEIFNEDDDIKYIKATIKEAELNRIRAHQINENQTRRLQNLIKESEEDEKVLENLGREKAEEEAIARKKKEDLINAKHIIQQQLRDKEKAKEESMKEYLRDKQQINDIVQQIMNEDRKAYEEDQRKKAIAKQYMDNAYAEKEEMKRRKKEEDRLEKERERKYLEDVAKREAEQAQKQQAIQAEKDKIFDKLCKDKAKAEAEKQYWEDVRNQLYDEEINRLNKLKELEEKEKLQRQKEEMLQCAIDQMKKKEEIRAKEKEIEDEIKRKLLAKYAEDEKLEEANRINQRNKMLALQEEIEKQWKLKLEQYKMQKERDLWELEYQRRLEEDKRKLIEQEKERLIKENEALLKDFFPKGYYGVCKTLKPTNQ